jgi:DNA-binding NarL/FixJ family response regulator
MSKPFKLLLIVSDPVFRMGLRAWLQQFGDLEAIAEAKTGNDALAMLAKQSAQEDSLIDLVILDLGLNGDKDTTRSEDMTGLTLCESIKSRYPKLPILLLTSPLPSEILAAALHIGVDGYCLKGSSSDELVNAIRTCAKGGKYLDELENISWQDGTYPVREAFPQSMGNRTPRANSSASQDEIVSVLGVMRRNLRISGLRQIDRALSGVQTYLADSASSESLWYAIERIVLEGRQRELLTSRWLLTYIFPVSKNAQAKSSMPHQVYSDPSYSQVESEMQFTSQSTEQFTGQSTEQPLINEQQLVRARFLQAEIFDLTAAKLQSGLYNLTNIPLEIDILKEEKKRELLFSILRHLEDLLVELRLSQVQPQQLPEQQGKVLRDLWRAATISFLGKYYSIKAGSDLRVAVVDVLLGDAEIVQAEILDEIPQVSELISYLLFQTDLIIDNATYAAGSLEARSRAENLLDNLLIALANAVIQPLLNHFANTEEVKQKFYDYHLIATREIERFRNNLSWKYRLKKYFQSPQAIFESRFDLFVLSSPGIKKQEIYAPRSQELAQLGGIQLAVTLALELQDAIAPRLRSAVAFLGSGIVYVLTNVVGRGIGLIGRGILQGIGSAWQDSRSRK